MADGAAGGGGGAVALGDAPSAFQAFKVAGGEDLGHEPHAGVGVEFETVGDRDAGGLLAAVLLGVEAEVDLPDGVGVTPDADHAAFVLGAVVEDRELDPVRHAGKGMPGRARPHTKNRPGSVPGRLFQTRFGPSGRLTGSRRCRR